MSIELDNGSDADAYYSLKDHIGLAIRTSLTASKGVSPQGSGSFSAETLSEIVESVVYQFDFDQSIEDRYIGYIADCIADFHNVSVTEKHIGMLIDVIHSAIEPALVSRALSTDYVEEDDGPDDSECVDQLGDAEERTAISQQQHQQDTGVRSRRKQMQLTDSITTTSNPSDIAYEQAELDAWMENEMAKSEQQYLAEESDYSHHEHQHHHPNHYESHLKGRASQYTTSEGIDSIDSKRAGSSDDESVQEVRHLPECKNASSSGSEGSGGSGTGSDDDTLHSERSLERRQCTGIQQQKQLPQGFASPEPYQIRKSAHSSSARTQEETAAEPLPAWLMPKSPLDSHFRKGYGGLGHADLDEVIAEVTSSQKKALRESRIADDNEQDSLGDGGSSSGPDISSEDTPSTGSGRSDEGKRGRDDEEEQEEEVALPAWEIPKSPLDAHFRKGYGGLGHADLDEVVEEVTTAQKKARAAVREHTRRVESKLGRLYSDSDSSISDSESGSGSGDSGTEDDEDRLSSDGGEFDALLQENIITVDDLPDDFGVVAAPTAFNPTTVGTPVQKRSPAARSTSTSSSAKTPQQPSNSRKSAAGGSEYAKQTKLFQSPNPGSIRVTVSSMKHQSGSSGKAGTVVSASEEVALPAWDIPKSPLDAHFRKGYGGLGHEDFTEAVEEITTAQKKARAKTATASTLRALEEKDGPNSTSVSKMLNFWLDGKRDETNRRVGGGKLKGAKRAVPVVPAVASNKAVTTASKEAKPSKVKSKTGVAKRSGAKDKKAAASTRIASRKRLKAATAAGEGEDEFGEASEQIMFDRIQEEYSFIDAKQAELAADDANGEHLLPSAHPSDRPVLDAEGNFRLTSNDRLNAMLQESFREHVAQYADRKLKENAISDAKVVSTTGASTRSPAQAVAAARDRTPAKEALDMQGEATDEEQDLDVRAFLASPHLQHSMDEIDDIIRANLRKLHSMRAKARALRGSPGGEGSPKNTQKTLPQRKATAPASRPKLTLRNSSSSFLIAPSSSSAALPAAASTKPLVAQQPRHQMARCKSTTTLHLRSTCSLQASAVDKAPASRAQTPTAVRPASRRNSRSSAASAGAGGIMEPSPSASKPLHTSKISAHLLSLHSKQTASSEAQRATAGATAARTAATGSSPLAAARPLSSNSRLLAPTTSALIRAADIATNSSKAANIHNEWHLQLRGGDHPEGDIDLSELKLRNQSIRRSLPTGDVDHIMEWSSPDRKSKSLDFSLGLGTKNHALHVLDSSAISSGTPRSSPARSPPTARRRGSGVGGAVWRGGSCRVDPVYIPPLPKESRLAAPTVATVMRSLDAAQQSPVIKRLQRELDEQTSKAYLFRGPKFAKNLASFQQAGAAKKRRTKKRRSGKKKE